MVSPAHTPDRLGPEERDWFKIAVRLRLPLVDPSFSVDVTSSDTKKAPGPPPRAGRYDKRDVTRKKGRTPFAHSQRHS